MRNEMEKRTTSCYEVKYYKPTSYSHEDITLLRLDSVKPCENAVNVMCPSFHGLLATSDLIKKVTSLH